MNIYIYIYNTYISLEAEPNWVWHVSDYDESLPHKPETLKSESLAQKNPEPLNPDLLKAPTP